MDMSTRPLQIANDYYDTSPLNLVIISRLPARPYRHTGLDNACGDTAPGRIVLQFRLARGVGSFPRLCCEGVSDVESEPATQTMGKTTLEGTRQTLTPMQPQESELGLRWVSVTVRLVTVETRTFSPTKGDNLHRRAWVRI